MPIAIPTALLNVKLHFLIDCVLAVVLILFQILALASAPDDPYEKIGIGIWGALVIAAAGIVSLRATATNSQFLLGSSFILAIFSFIFSFSIMGIFAAAIDACSAQPDTTPPDTTPCSPARVGFDSILLICGIIGIPVNGLLIAGVVSAYEPPATAPAA